MKYPAMVYNKQCQSELKTDSFNKQFLCPNCLNLHNQLAIIFSILLMFLICLHYDSVLQTSPFTKILIGLQRVQSSKYSTGNHYVNVKEVKVNLLYFSC